MSLFSSLGKAVKNLFSGIGKVFKKVVSSDLGKALLIGATLYLGGAALKLWSGPSWLGGGTAAAGESAVASTATSTATAAEAGTAAALPTEAVSTAAQSGASAAEAAQAAAADGAVAGGGQAAGAVDAAGAPEGLITQADKAGAATGGGAPSQVAASSAAPVGGAQGASGMAGDALVQEQLAAGVVTPEQASMFSQLQTGMDPLSAAKASGMPQSVIDSIAGQAPKGLLGKAGAFLGKHPLLGYGGMMVGGQMIAGAMAPDATEEQLKLERERRLASNYGGVYGDGRREEIILPHAGLLTRAGRQSYNPRG